MFCCRKKFQPKESYILEPKGYAERILESGFCPQCGAWVVEIWKKDYGGYWKVETAKRKKALKLYNDNLPDIIAGLEKEVKYGSRTNMGFKYGENVEVKNRKGNKFIRQYAVDFNGVKELIKIF